MSVSVGSMSAGLGLDLSEFQNGMQRATELARSNSTLMSAELKRTSREGAESLRLIDESLGIHVSRPLTRILTQEFPAFATALQTVLGGAVFGAVATIGVEVFEKVAKSIEKAQKAQEEWKQSIEKSEEVIQSVGDTFAKKIAEANGISDIAKEAMSGAEEAKKGFDQVAAAIDNENKKAEEASSTWTKFKAAIGDFFHQTFSSDATLNVEGLKEQLGTLKIEIDNAFRLDALHGTHTAMKVFQEDLTLATQKLKELQEQKAREEAQLVETFDALGNSTGEQAAGVSTITPQQLAAVQQWVDLLNRAIGIEKDRDALEKANLASAARAEAAKQELAAQEKIAALYKEMGSSLAKLQPEIDPIKKLDSEIAGFRSTAEANFREIGRSAASALATSAALAGLLSYEKKLDELKLKLEGDILAKQALDLLNKPLPGGPPAGTSVPGLAAAPAPALPTLGSGGAAAAQFDAFAGDTLAKNRLIAQMFQDAITPAEEYQLKVKELKLAFEGLPPELRDSAQAQQAFSAELAKFGEMETKTELHLRKMQEELVHLLEKSTSASAGVHAFFLQMQIDSAQGGKFTFDILNHGLQGFEDNTVSMLMTGKAHWQSYFNELAAMALKFLLNKELSSLLQSLAGLGIGGAGGGGGLPDFMNLPANAFGGFPGFAGGTDYTPGGPAWVGEKGPEIVNLPAGGSVTPNSALRGAGGGDTNHYYDMRGSVVTDDLMRKADAVRMSQATKRQAVGEALANFSEVQRRTPKR